MSNIILFGPPGAGKGTQSERIIKQYQLVPVALGMLLREHIEKETSFKADVEGYINNGHLVPDALSISIVEEKIKKNKGAYLLFDGFPRTLTQAHYLDHTLKQWEQQIDHVIFLDVAENFLRERIRKRAATLGRLDDQDSKKITQRMETYMAETLPIVTYYEKEGKLTTLNGLAPIDTIFEHIVVIMQSIQKG